MIRESSAQSWTQRIQACQSFEALRQARDTIQQELHTTLPTQDAEIWSWYTQVNACQDQLIKQAVLIAELVLFERDGLKPPCPYTLLLLGSGGRSERTLWSDQDNALIYRDEHLDAADYFLKLSAMLDMGLKKIGYIPCDGKVSSANPMWCKSLSAWKATLAEWFADGSWESVRYLLIVADARSVYGERRLTDHFRRQFELLVQTTPHILAEMLRNTLRHKIVLSPLGNLIVEAYGEYAGGFDMKYGAYIPMVNAIRLLAIKHQISDTSTCSRMEKLQTVIEQETLDRWKEAFTFFLRMRAVTPYQLTAEDYYTTTGILPAQQMDRRMKSKLKVMVQIGVQLQRYIQKAGLA